MKRFGSLALLIVIALIGAAGPGSADAAVRPVKVRFTVRLLDEPGATMRQTGTFSGAPFGRGRVDIRSAIGKGKGARITFLLTNRAGKLRATGDVTLKFSGTSVHYSGTARITAGTGRYRHAHSRTLRLDGHGDITGERFGVVLSGRIAGV